ncbi:hypothetical protein DRI50_10145 [candidate division KSB1 bacterium]|nr:MAG: hypothetical protein DRI50_10145 [candidate division KSB1 bacterium]
MNIKFSAFILVLLAFFMFNCAGTRKKEEPAKVNQAANQDQDLTDIEALLGIDTNAKKPAKKSTKKKKDEKLNLLNENEVANPDQATGGPGLTSREKREYERKIKSLQQQLKDKDQIIRQLKDQLNQQSLEITQLKSRKETTTTYQPPKTSVPGTPVSMVASGEYEQTYQKARESFEARDYQTALSLFQSLIASNPNHPLADNAQYWIGECHYALRQYDAAIMDFQKVFTFPNSNKMADAQFKLVLCYLRKGEVEKAREEFQRLRAEFPDSPYVSRAEAILAKY